MNMNDKDNKACNAKDMYTLPNDMTVHHLNEIETKFLYKEIFENNTYMKHGISLQEGAVVFDVGANIGMFTLFIKSTVDNAKVFTFEPIPDICRILRLNAAPFGSDVVVYECGLSNEDRTAVLTYYPGYSILSGFYADLSQDSEIFLSGAMLHWQSTRKKQKEMPERAKELLVEKTLSSRVECSCKLTTVSKVMREHGVQQIDLLKVDVERSELDIMDGIDRADWSKIRQIVMEVHDFEGGLTERIDAFLKDKGFTTVIEKEEHLGSQYTPNIYARRI